MLRFYEQKENGFLSGSNGFLANLTFVFLAIVLHSGNGFAQTPETFQKTKSATASPEQLSASFAHVAKRVELAVVNIDTKGRIPDVKLRGRNSLRRDDLRESFSRIVPRRPSYAVGSGFILDSRGYIMTNYHVVEDSAKITVRLRSGEEYIARIIGADELTDLAVLKIDAEKPLPFLSFGDSEAISIGDWVLAIGSPFGLEQTVTAGIISQTKRETPAASAFQKFIQTDAAINRGNSGGPLVSMNGLVIGVNSQIATSTGDYNGIGFALPANEANYVYQQILQYGKVRRGYLGVVLDSVKKEFAEVYRLPEAKGAIITRIGDPLGAGVKAGLLKDDIIVKLNGNPVENHQDLISKVASVVPGDMISLTIFREAGDVLERKVINVKLGERPVDEIASSDNTKRKLPVNPTAGKSTPFKGLTVVTTSTSRRQSVRSKKGVVVTAIAPESYMADIKNTGGGDALREGDIIQRVNRSKIENLTAFNQKAGELRAGSAVVFHILRYNRPDREFVPMVVQFTAR